MMKINVKFRTLDLNKWNINSPLLWAVKNYCLLIPVVLDDICCRLGVTPTCHL